MLSYLGRVEAGDEPEREESSIVDGKSAKGAPEVDDGRALPEVVVPMPVDRIGNVDHDGAPLPTHLLASLVRRNCDEPRPDLGRLADAADPSPGDAPSGLDGVESHLAIAQDHVGNPRHHSVVFRDQSGKRRLIARRRASDRPLGC